jgi:predicted TIM-barrel fold metal-dependent hydrolase
VAGRPPLRIPPSVQLRRLYVDTATPSRHALAGAVATFGAGHVLYGTDSPPLTTPLQRSLDLIAELPGPPSLRQGIREDNARALFGLGPDPEGY